MLTDVKKNDTLHNYFKSPHCIYLMDDHVLELQVYSNSVTSRHLGKERIYGETRKTEKKTRYRELQANRISRTKQIHRSGPQLMKPNLDRK